MKGADIVMISTSLPDAQAARILAKNLVERRMVACAKVLDQVQSIYWWDGEVTCEDEVILLMKTTRGVSEDVRKAVLDKHPYDLPELMIFAPDFVESAYGDWVETNVSKKFI